MPVVPVGDRCRGPTGMQSDQDLIRLCAFSVVGPMVGDSYPRNGRQKPSPASSGLPISIIGVRQGWRDDANLWLCFFMRWCHDR